MVWCVYVYCTYNVYTDMNRHKNTDMVLDKGFFLVKIPFVRPGGPGSEGMLLENVDFFSS